MPEEIFLFPYHRTAEMLPLLQEVQHLLPDMEKEKEITEDDLHRAQDKVQEKVDEAIEEIDELCKKKEEEIMEV